MNKEQRDALIENMYGSWKSTEQLDENTVLECSLKVTKQVVHFIAKKNGNEIKNDEFHPSGFHWMGDDYLYSIDTKKHFISHADENEIVFGLLTTLGNFDGNYEFHQNLKRVN